jgi:hypothetical protein
MGRAKEIIIRVIPSKIANEFVRKYHYSGKVVNNSILHFGAFLNERLHGVMSYGSPLDKRKIIGLVVPTQWNEMLELNRMAFDECLPKNSESRCIAISIKLIKKHSPHIKWVLSFADATQCWDGAIYRASGFVLTGIKENDQIIEFPDGLRETRLVLTDSRRPRRIEMAKRYNAKIGGECSLIPFLSIGAKTVKGFQLRYIYLIDKTCKLTVPIIPFSKIDELGAGMYRGKPIIRGNSINGNAPGDQLGKDVRGDLAALKCELNTNHVEL